MTEQLQTIDTVDTSPFKKLVMTIGELPTSFVESMSYYECLAWLTNYIENTVIPAVNNNAEALEELQGLFVQLKNYVDTYFDNLDVQEEINHKIDSMVVDGTFQNILNGYVTPYLEGLSAEITAEATTRAEADNNLQEQITAIGNGSPLTATSISEMTDTTKVYVNTTDGKWYYYDGDSWEIGGDFQSTVIGENTIQPYMTKFMESKNLLPYTGWIEGKVWSWTTGDEMTYNNGCLHTTEVSVTSGEVILILNDNLLPTTDFYIDEYAEDDSFVKSTRVGYTLTQRVVIDENTSYIKFCSLTNKFSTLPVNSIMIVRLSDFKDITSFNSIFDYKAGTRPSIKSEEIVITNKYGHKLIPRLYRSSHLSNTIANLKYPNPYIMEYSSTVTGTTASVNALLGSYVFADNVTTDDYFYVDYSDSTIKPTYIAIWAGGSAQGYMTSVDSTNGIWRIKVNENIKNGLAVGDCFFYGQYNNYPTGETLTTRVATYFNDNYSDIVKIIQAEETPAPIKTMFLGDSITHLSGARSWTDKFNTIINGNTVANVAVDGARLRDFENTVYDGNPSQSVPASNVLGNQVQKIINNNYETPDVILIAIGTNGGISVQGNELNDAFFTNNSVKPIEDVDRKTDAGAYRWCTQKLNETYPNAKIIWCTPIQSSYANAKRPATVKEWGDNLKEFCTWGSTYCFDTEKCGINTLNADINLYDGLHPESTGAQLIADYNAGEFNKLINVILSKR